jgi:uncharacterized RDD family membrane protein YckC
MENSKTLIYRFFAYAVDGLILTLMMLSFYPLSMRIEQLGPLAWGPSLILYCLYFAYFDSGQRVSPGKRIFGLRILKATSQSNGGSLNFGSALLRALFVALPSYNGLIGALLPPNQFLDLAYLVFISIVFFGQIIVPLVHPTRRALQDLVFGTAVVRHLAVATGVPVSSNPNPGPVPKLHSDFAIPSGPRWTPATLAAAILPTVIFLGLFIWASGGLSGADRDDLKAVAAAIQTKVHVDTPSVGIETFRLDNRPPVRSMTATTVIPYHVYADSMQREVLKERIFPIMKSMLHDPSVENLRIQFTTRRYFGLLSLAEAVTGTKRVVDVESEGDSTP